MNKFEDIEIPLTGNGDPMRSLTAAACDIY